MKYLVLVLLASLPTIVYAKPVKHRPMPVYVNHLPDAIMHAPGQSNPDRAPFSGQVIAPMIMPVPGVPYNENWDYILSRPKSGNSGT